MSDLGTRSRLVPIRDRWSGLYHHVYVDAQTGAVLAVTTGTQDGDAYERAKQELHRRGIGWEGP